MSWPHPTPRPDRAFWLVLAAGLVLRLLLLPLPNTDNDVVFQTWSRMVTVEGFTDIYDVYDPTGVPPRECQYPPGYLYVLWAVGSVYQATVSPEFAPDTIALLMLLRVPTVLADLALAVIVFVSLGRRWGRRTALLGFAAYVFAPHTILDSTVVTQIDSVQSLLMVGTVLLLAGGRGTAALACLALAALTKPQAAVLAPLVGLAVLRHHGVRVLLRGVAAGVGILVVLSLPFLVHGKTFELVRMFTSFVGVAPYQSLNAYNLWWLLTGGDGWRPDDVAVLGSLTSRQVGLGLLGLAALAGVWRVWRDASRSSVLLAALWTTFAFFVLTTEMTERYLLVVFPLALLLAPHARSYRLLCAVLFVTTAVNLALVYPLVAVAPWNALDLPHSNWFHYLHPAHGPPLPVLAPWARLGDPRPGHEFPPWGAISLVVSAIHVLALGFLATRIRPRPDGEAAGAGPRAGS